MSNIEESRTQHLAMWQNNGFAYPSFSRSHSLSALQQTYEHNTSEELASQPVSVRVAGRVMSKRLMGKVGFWDIHDGESNIQLFLKHGVTQDFDLLQYMDTGDIVGCVGEVMRTKTGELSVRASQIILLSKNLDILPLSHDGEGLQDVETRYRKRYVDLIVNNDSRQTFVNRSYIVRAVRRALDERAFLEVETPMMQSLHGGANARPFETHHQALDAQLYLRVAPELYLKRLVVGGMTRVYELNRNFRNEGVSTRHNPEFTMLEVYEAYTTFTEMMDLCEYLIQQACQSVHTSLSVTWNECVLDLSTFRRVRMDDLVAQEYGLMRDELRCQGVLEDIIAQEGLAPANSWGEQLLQLFEHKIEASLVQPTFVTHYPIEVSPLARGNDEEPHLTDRFELFVGGIEMANGFSELNDPFEQARRMREQAQQHISGESEAMLFDQDYIDALRVGLPPCGGLGLGIDRLVMMLTDSASIRDVLLFPLMRPKDQASS